MTWFPNYRETASMNRRIRKARRKRDQFQAAEKQKRYGKRTISSQIGWAVDRALYPFAPLSATRRMTARLKYEIVEGRMQNLAGRSFSAARDEEHRKDRWLISRLSPDSALEEDLRELQDRCAEMARNSIVASSAVESRVSNEVGVGLSPHPMAKRVEGRITKEQAANFNDDLKEIYKEWSRKGVDRSRILSLPQFQKQVNRTFAIYGEAFVIFGAAPTRGSMSLAMEIITPERVETPPEKSGDENCVMGIQYDSKGEVVIGYHVRQRHPGEQGRRSSHRYQYIPRYDPQTGKPRMVHVFEPVFPGQSRGIPWYAAAMNRMKDTDDMFEVELIQRQVETCMGVFITGGDDSISPQDMAEQNASSTNSRGQRIEELYPAGVNYLDEGQTVTTVDPNRPGTSFQPFIEQSLRSIASSLNMPYEILAKNFMRVTYSSGRLAMLDGRLGFRMRTQTLKDMWLCPLHELIVWESIMTGIVRDDLIVPYNLSPYQLERHDWRGRNSGLLDPEKERKGHAIGLKNRLDSRGSIKGEEAVDIEDLEHELLTEGKMEIERDVELAKYRQDLEKSNGLMPGQSFPIESGSTDIFDTRTSDRAEEGDEEPVNQNR